MQYALQCRSSQPKRNCWGFSRIAGQGFYSFASVLAQHSLVTNTVLMESL